jgi:O-antigen/teichoic acid export membrane protein
MSTHEMSAQQVPGVTRDGRYTHYLSTVVGQGLILGLGVLTGTLSARMLGPTGRGELAAIVLWPTAIALLLSFGLNQAIAFHIGRRSFSIHEIATASATIGIVQGSLAILLGLWIVPKVLSKYPPSVQHLGILFALFTPALILAGYSANFFQGSQDLARFNIIRTLSPFAYCCALIALFVLRSGSLKLVVVSQIAATVIALGLGTLLARRYLRPHFRWNSEAIPRLLGFGWRTQATNLTSTFNQRVDQLMLSLFVAPQQLGWYAVAVTLSNAITVVPQAAGIVTFSRGAAQDREHAVETLRTSFRGSLAWLVACCGVLYFAAPILIRVAFGPQFEGSILACRILLPGALMIGLNQVLYSGASALEHPGLPSIAESVGMVVTIVGLYLLVPRWGYLGAAAVSSISYGVSFLVMLLLTRTVLRMPLAALVFHPPLLVTPVRAPSEEACR